MRQAIDNSFPTIPPIYEVEGYLHYLITTIGHDIAGTHYPSPILAMIHCVEFDPERDEIQSEINNRIFQVCDGCRAWNYYGHNLNRRTELDYLDYAIALNEGNSFVGSCDFCNIEWPEGYGDNASGSAIVRPILFAQEFKSTHGDYPSRRYCH